MKILSVELKRKVDDSPDTSYLGEYQNEPGPDDKTIDRWERDDMGRNEYRYFVAANSGTETGNPESVEQDYERMEALNRGDWCYMGVYAVAEVTLTTDPQGNTVQTIRSGGLWGIESDSDESYFQSIEKDELADLRDQLKAMGFNTRAINKAFREVVKQEA